MNNLSTVNQWIGHVCAVTLIAAIHELTLQQPPLYMDHFSQHSNDPKL